MRKFILTICLLMLCQLSFAQSWEDIRNRLIASERATFTVNLVSKINPDVTKIKYADKLIYLAKSRYSSATEFLKDVDKNGDHIELECMRSFMSGYPTSSLGNLVEIFFPSIKGVGAKAFYQAELISRYSSVMALFEQMMLSPKDFTNTMQSIQNEVEIRIKKINDRSNTQVR